MSNDASYERAYLREKKARKHAEELLELKSREIFNINRDLEKQYVTLLKRSTELELLNELTSYAQNDITTVEALQFFVSIVCATCQWPVGLIYIPDPDDQEMLLPSNIWHIKDSEIYKSFKEATRDLKIKSGESLPGKVYQNNEPLWIEDNQSDIYKNIQNTDTASTFGVPIAIYGRVKAVAEFASFDGHCLDEELLKTAHTAARQLGTILERRESEKKKLESYEKLQQAQNQLVQSEKMASVGQLAAGVAHEINNPIAFVSSNINALQDYIESFKQLFDLYEQLTDQISDEDSKSLLAEINQAIDDIDFEFIKEDIDQLLVDSNDGMHRVSEIVKGLKNFSRVDTVETGSVNLNDCLIATLKMLNNEIKYKAEVVTDLQPLPLLSCNAGKLNQVFTNLIINASHAIEDQGCITVTSRATDSDIKISVADTGKGIADEHMNELFTPFFTTKPVGEGTGLGLSISYGIVKEHHGSIDVVSKLGQGTTFTVNLPHSSV